MRRPFVAGNWKMNTTLAEGRTLIRGLREKLPPKPPIDVAVCPPFVYLLPACKEIDGTPIRLGAQDCYCEARGAFTGEVSAGMLRDAGCTYVIIGHSERRHVIGETGDLLRKKVAAAVEAGLEVIYCIGETIEERQAGETEAVVARHLHQALTPELAIERVTLAYEPVWAIGTGHNATPQQAQDVHEFVRGELARIYDDTVAERTRIQYGGSVKPSNAGELMAQRDVDGALVGGASLKADDFIGIIEATIKAKGLA